MTGLLIAGSSAAMMVFGIWLLKISSPPPTRRKKKAKLSAKQQRLQKVGWIFTIAGGILFVLAISGLLQGATPEGQAGM